MFRLALRNVFRNRMRTALTLSAIVCGVAAIIVGGGFVEDVFVQLRETTIHSRLGHLQIYRKGYSEHGARDPARYVIGDPEVVRERLLTLPHVAAVATRVQLSALANNGRADVPVVVEGVEADQEKRLGTAITLVEGRALANGDRFGAMLGAGVAQSLHLHVGSPLNLTVNTSGGALNAMEFRVIGIFRTFSKEYDDRAVRIGAADAGDLGNSRAVHAVVVLLDDTASTDAVLSEMRARLPDGEYEVKPWYELADFYNKTVALYRRQFGALELVILALLVLGVASTVNMVIYERTGEFGTLLALGSRPRHVFTLVVLENALLGAIGAVLGLLLGVAIAAVLSSIGIEMPPPPGSTLSYVASIRAGAGIAAGSAAVGLASTIVASIFPARRASLLRVVEALRHNV